MALPNWTVVGSASGGLTSPPTATGPAPGDVTAITVTGFIDPISAAITLTVGVTPPATIGSFIGCHIFLEAPDQSSVAVFTVGSSALGGSAAVVGPWVPIDCGDQPYVATQQPWTITVPGPPSLDPTVNTPCRIYAVSYSTGIENKLVQANQTGASPNQTFTLVSLASGSPTSGTNVTGLTVASGAQVAIVATALAPVNITGKLQTPVEVIVSDTPTTSGWAFQLVLTYFGQDPTQAANQYVMSGIETQAGPVQAGADGLSEPHSFLLDTPTTVTTAIVWLQAGLVDSSGNFTGNNIVPGITPSFSITYGSTVGTTDASAIMTATIAASMAITSGLFGVAASGITSSLIGAGAVATINIQNLAVTNPLLASLAVQAANMAANSVTASNGALAAAAVVAASLAGSSVTATAIANAAVGSAAIANLAVGTAAIQAGAITNALIANAAVANANIISATITGASIASATIAGANIGTATIAQANLANLSVGTAQIQSLAVTDAKINDLSAAKITAGTITASIGITAATITGSSLTINAGTTTLSLNGSSFFSLTDTISGITSAVGVSGFQVTVNSIPAEGAFLSSGSLIITNSSGNQNINLSGTALSIRSIGTVVQVVGPRQAGPGAPSGFADSVAQTWCSNLYNALRASGGHGLVN